MKKNIITYVVFFVALIGLTRLQAIDNDTIWGYGFSYNISQGLIPYKDFNMVIGPLYSLFLSIPMRFFGNYIFLFEMMHAIIYSFLFLFLYRQIGKKTYLIFILYLTMITYGYNAFSLTLLMFILLLSNSKLKYKQLLIGLLIGIILMTKHNIGLFLLFVYLYDNRKCLLNIIYPLIPVILTFAYLNVHNVVDAYIDFCFLGMNNFLDNIYVSLPGLTIYLFFLFQVIKKYPSTKDIRILYISAFSVIMFPICDAGHIIPAIIPVMYYIILSNDPISYLLIEWFCILGFVGYAVINVCTNEFVTANNFLKFKAVEKGFYTKYLLGYNKYLNTISDDSVYLFQDNAYIIKLYQNKTLGFYDLINKGNLGPNEQGYVDKLDENCSNEKCYFILDYKFFKEWSGSHRKSIFDVPRYQTNELFRDYVINNATYLETLPSGDRIYVNEKGED